MTEVDEEVMNEILDQSRAGRSRPYLLLKYEAFFKKFPHMRDELFDTPLHLNKGKRVEWSGTFGDGPDSDKENEDVIMDEEIDEEEVGECIACGEEDCNGNCVKDAKVTDFCPECKVNNRLRGYNTECDTCMSV